MDLHSWKKCFCFHGNLEYVPCTNKSDFSPNKWKKGDQKKLSAHNVCSKLNFVYLTNY